MKNQSKKKKKKKEERKVRDPRRDGDFERLSESARGREAAPQRCRRDGETRETESETTRPTLATARARPTICLAQRDPRSARARPTTRPTPVAVSRSAQPSFEPSQNHSSQNHRYLLFNSYLFLQISKPCESVI